MPALLLTLLGPRAALAATAGVDIVDNAYVPDEVTIEVGDTVEWSWRGSNPHSVTGSERSFDSHPDCSFLEPERCGTRGETFSRTFDEAGEYSYFCKVHPDQMRGTITVVDPAAEPAPEPSVSPPGEESPSPSESPSPEPSPDDDPDEGQPGSSPSPSEDGGSSPSPQDSPSPRPSPSRDDSPAPAPRLPAPGAEPDTVYRPPPPREPEPLPTITEGDDPIAIPEPDVAQEDLDLEPFPEPNIDDPLADDEVAIPGLGGDGGGGDDGTTRTILLAVATVGVLGTATAFSSLVLFGPPW